MIDIKTEQELLEKLEALGPMDEATRNGIVCNLIGHSKIQTFCFGYYCCARCGDQLGDTLGGTYTGAIDAVIVGHKCHICETNYEKCTWKDKIFCPDPFAEDSDEEEDTDDDGLE